MIEQIFEMLENSEDELIAIRRELHKFPELSFEEVVTPKKIATYLKDLDIEHRTEVGGRGVVGYIRGKKGGKTVALRADFDALPIHEETGLPFASTVPGKMHACGHDGHTAALLLVAKSLKQQEHQLLGDVVLIFQFAEELAPGGAISMIEDGCLKDVDAIFGAHLWTPLPYGEIGFREGAFMGAADRFELTVKGRGGHGASPHETVDSITVATSIVQQLQQIVSRNVDPLKSAVISIGSFHAGEAFNVIPDTAKIVGTVRTFEEGIQSFIIERMNQVVNGICLAAGADYEFDYKKGYPTVVNSKTETEKLVQWSVSNLKNQKVIEIDPVMGGEDFAYYLKHVPGSFFFIGAGNESLGKTYPHHHPKFDFDESALLVAAKLLATAAVHYLEDEKLVGENLVECT
ncbi:M20 metallopeptidase family protein [Alkalihalobacillus trypoxylicola]|uniref:Peptidase M20 n=1 Tax=Alkalihalobacillus trypoxylicola TaxID=519424 RepID=A0A161PHP5_9BACI|nr:amidohydrolase [Alkalihalobacillus trypoxylicola]KYG33135.1 peptidase M20 [Alkalihalobacillus trypoxylicola]